jgi:plastocyanin
MEHAMPRTSNHLTPALVFAVVLTASACAENQAGTSAINPTGISGRVEVSIDRDSAVGFYNPGEVEVGVGDEVVWFNRSGVVHNVVFDDPEIVSSRLFNHGESFTTSFPEVGSFEYICTIHPTMRGVVTAVR